MQDCPALPMSHIIAPDAPLLSPVSSYGSVCSPEPSPDAFQFNYYSLPTPPEPSSPIHPSKMLKSCASSFATFSSDQLCLPTHQLFDLVPQNTPQQQAPSSPPQQLQQTLAVAIPDPSPPPEEEPPTKRVAAEAPGATKKPRASAERIYSKDFIPPDVSGLTKREARLVKNRAAAFLSRQRKREEFESMEIRVGELEEENARLLALAKSTSPSASEANPAFESVLSEVEQLRAQLAAAQERERELTARIAHSPIPPTHQIVKSEAHDLPIPASPPRSNPPLKSSASFGLMVLLCALPTLLSMPTNNAMPSSFSSNFESAAPVSSSNFDFNSFLANDYDWTKSGLMDLDVDDQGRITALASPSSRTAQKLQFADLPSSLEGLNDLGGLDISFDTTTVENGKIRVRIHPSQSPTSSRESSVLGDSASSSGSSLASWSDEPLETTFSTDPYSLSKTLSSLSPSASDPFFGVGDNSDFAFGALNHGSPMYGQETDFAGDYVSNFGSEQEFDSLSTSSGCASKRRVRVTLKSLPTTGGEGGEWEVQFC